MRGEAIRMKNVFRIQRGLDPGQYRLANVFVDIRTYGVLHVIFADAEEIDGVMERTKVLVANWPHEMCVDNDNASITIGLKHLRCASDEFLYLDIVHELCHVKQHLQGRNLYDRSKAYVDRDTEIEAYEITVQEARRIGLNDDAIAHYLRVTWITPEEHKRLLGRLGVTEGIQEGD
jgi:hypothetical protein